MWCVYITHDDRRCIQWEGPLVERGRGPREGGVAHRTPAPLSSMLSRTRCCLAELGYSAALGQHSPLITPGGLGKG